MASVDLFSNTGLTLSRNNNGPNIFSTASFFTRDTDASLKAYALAGSDASYKYYNNMTWSMWAALLPAVNKTLWSMWETASGNNRGWLFSTQLDGTFRIIFSWDGSSFSLQKTHNAITDLSWAHIVVTFASGVAQVYVNNVLQTLDTTIAWGGGVAPMFSADVQVGFGTIDPSSPPIDNSCGGAFNNFSMWNVVLNGVQIAELYNSGIPGDLTKHSAFANLTNWWRMDQTSTAPTLTDSIAAGASATITTSGSGAVFQKTSQCAKL